MLKLVSYNAKHYKTLNYKLPLAHAKFTSTIDQCKKDKVFSDSQKSVITIIYNEEPIGFFILDRGVAKTKLTDNKYAILLRSFSINPIYQGKGLGKKAVLLITDLLRKKYPDINEIVLSVNVMNINAYNTYLNAGFVDTQKYIEGILGKQHVLYKEIK
ncbi:MULTISPECIES: GNAT family N-acetyltransferase [Flavobacteriales]|uniref:GNAT family N-acetyltransferase n=1 Tax=Flavobacteriales TaxID=200644 RepID=UPI00132F7F83|nr:MULTISPECIES: GNAT family N-acetyltransferase [Flavobacteriales]